MVHPTFGFRLLRSDRLADLKPSTTPEMNSLWLVSSAPLPFLPFDKVLESQFRVDVALRTRRYVPTATLLAALAAARQALVEQLIDLTT